MTTSQKILATIVLSCFGLGGIMIAIFFLWGKKK
jgi:hypothetical protein